MYDSCCCCRSVLLVHCRAPPLTATLPASQPAASQSAAASESDVPFHSTPPVHLQPISSDSHCRQPLPFIDSPAPLLHLVHRFLSAPSNDTFFLPLRRRRIDSLPVVE